MRPAERRKDLEQIEVEQVVAHPTLSAEMSSRFQIPKVQYKLVYKDVSGINVPKGHV
jgi:hypothetical protein